MDNRPRIVVAFLTLSFMVLIASVGFAQEDTFIQEFYWGYWGASEGAYDLGFGAEFEEKVRDAEERLEAIKIWRMTEVLGLSVEQSTTFFPLYRQLEDVRQEHFIEREGTIRELLDLLNNAESDVDEVKDKTEELLATKASLVGQEADIFVSMGEVLDDIQLGRFLIFEETFQREILSVIQDIRAGNTMLKQMLKPPREGGVYEPFKKTEKKEEE